jgi:hypothetical protein
VSQGPVEAGPQRRTFATVLPEAYQRERQLPNQLGRLIQGTVVNYEQRQTGVKRFPDNLQNGFFRIVSGYDYADSHAAASSFSV